MTTRLYFVHALSPLHAGTGQGSGVIDLPIAREKATGLPFLPGSSVKGVLREKARSADYAEQEGRNIAYDKRVEADLTYALFGPRTENASEFAGSLQLADARLLLLPVRSLRGTFAWTTSPYVLRRLARDAGDAKLAGAPNLPALTDSQCDVAPGTKLAVALADDSEVALAERLHAARERGLLVVQSDWYWTSPLAGWELPEALARELAQCGLLISKGDANYRRWLGDRHWPSDAPLSRVLAYVPAPLLLLRTAKSEVAAGLDPARMTMAAARDPQWRTSGRWGLIQLSAGEPQA